MPRDFNLGAHKACAEDVGHGVNVEHYACHVDLPPLSLWDILDGMGAPGPAVPDRIAHYGRRVNLRGGDRK